MVVRKIYIDQDKAPSNIIVSPRLNKVDVASFVAAAGAVIVVAEVAIKKRPLRARPHPPQTDAWMRSPANAERRGVITTLV